MGHHLVESFKKLLEELDALPPEDQIETINAMRLLLHQRSPLQCHPVDCVLWVPAERVVANDYNPNTVAPPEMELLRLSIEEDGFTQPIVVHPEEGAYVVVDGFHRHLVGKFHQEVAQTLHGYLPVTIVRPDREAIDERMASTIRHNRARGKHGVEAMSRLVLELSRRNWSDTKIAKKLGMDMDEVLRMKQMTGLAELFSCEEFSEAWAPTELE